MDAAPGPRYLTSRALVALGVPHGFSTRLGGVSEGPFASQNLIQVEGEDPAHVAENRRRLLDALGLGRRALITLRQVHGVACALALPEGVGAPARGREPWTIARPGEAATGDALICRAPELAIAVGTADCVPILIAGPEGRIVAAVHSGWKGTAAGILPRVIARLAEDFDAPPGGLTLAIGPAIGLGSFEVGPEVVAGVLGALGLREDAATRGGILAPGQGDRSYLDLKEAVRRQALAAGVPGAQIDVLDRDTAGEEALFFSHRRDRGRTGRQLNVIAPKGGSEL